MPLESARERSKGFLRSLERYTKTDMVYLASGSFWLTLDQIAGALIAFALVVGFGHFVSPDVYGTYRYLLAAFWILAAFTLTGLPTALSQAVARGYEGAFRQSFRLSLIGSLPLMLIGFCVSGYYFLAGNTILGYGLLAIALLGPLMQPAHLFGPFLSGKKDFRTMALFGVFFALGPAVSLGIVMLFTHNPLVFFVTYLLSTILTGLVLYFVTQRTHTPNTATTSDLRSLSGHFSIMNLLSTVAAQADKIIVFHYLGAVELAIYTFAVALPEQIKGLFSAAPVLAFPKFATRSLEDIQKNFWARLWIFTGVLALASIAYIVLAPLLFQLFFPKYIVAVSYSQLFALSLFMTVVTVPTTLLQAKAAKRELYIFNFLSPVFQVGILIFLTMSYGLTGTIIARILGRAFSLLLGTGLAYSFIGKSSQEGLESSK